MNLIRKRFAAATLVLFLIGLSAFLAWNRGLFTKAKTRTRPKLDTQSIASALKSDFAKMGWNRFRGPNGTGRSNDPLIPSEWDETNNLRWKTELPGRGSSSPVLSSEKVFLTTYVADSNDDGILNSLQRFLCCIDQESGAIDWSKSIDTILPESANRGVGIPEHGYATNSCVVDERFVYSFYGKSGVYCHDHDGNEIWRISVGTGLNRNNWGSCASLILFNDILIVNAAEECGSLLGIEKSTGKEVWRAGEKLSFSFSTPALVPVDSDRTDLVVAVVGELWGLNPTNGKLVWFAESPIGGNVSPCVNVDGDLVYSYGGFDQRGSICVQAGGTGDVTESRLRWKSKTASYVASPVIYEKKIYWVGDSGMYHCVDALTGERIAKARMPRGVGNSRPVYASAIAINDRIFVQTRRRGVFVLETGGPLKILSHNMFESDDSMFNATPAVGGGQLFLRSDQFLYCVGKK